MTKPPSRRPKLYIVNLQVTWAPRAPSLDLGLSTGEPESPWDIHVPQSRPQRSGRPGAKASRPLGRSEVLPSFAFPSPQWTPKDDWAALKLHGKCDDVMQLLMDELGLEIPPYSR